MQIVIGTAGWTIPAAAAHHFPAEGSSLQRYASLFAGAEINSSFHRSHRLSTWQRWADSVPDGFLFSVKMPRAITHGARLAPPPEILEAALAEQRMLGGKIAVHLVQLPPSLAFEPHVAKTFFSAMRALSDAAIACEPRHPSWFAPEAERCLLAWEVARVAADPARVEPAARPGGWPGLVYFRLHGSPIIYRSSYADERLAFYAQQIGRAAAEGRPVWCMFDNTASSAATGDALALMERLGLR